MSNTNTTHQDPDRTMHLYGLSAEFETVDSLLKAAAQVRDAGFSKWDSHTPFPVHGLDKAMGVKPTILPWMTLLAGLTGLSFAIGMQWWMNAYDYPFVISGKPDWSLPANIPVGFELTVLFAALTTFFGVLGLNKLPLLFHPLLTNKRFTRFSNDRFFITIEAEDKLFERDRTTALLKAAGAVTVEHVFSPPKIAWQFPKYTFSIAAVFVALSLLPLAIAQRARVATSDKPRFHIVPDMDHQPKYKAQMANPFFEDGRATRLPVEGTVAQGDLRDDVAFIEGQVNGDWLTKFPDNFTVSAESMQRGQERFRIYCSPCHGLAGDGDGAVARRAEELREGKWVAPTSLHAAHVITQPVGQVFNTITNGIRNMPAYGPQIPVADRWAITLYVKALQRSRDAALNDVPKERLPELK